MTAELRSRRVDATLVLSISEPATRNTLSMQVCDAGIEALNVAESDASVRCVVLTGDGGHFCAGADQQQLAAARNGLASSIGAQQQAGQITRFHDWIEALRTFPKPVVAAVEGVAYGGGFSLALACDLIVAARDARFMTASSPAGLSPDGGLSWHLARQLPRSLALGALWLGQPLSATQMLEYGLVHQLSDSERAFNDALNLAARLAAVPEGSIAAIKELVNQAAGSSLQAQLQRERELFLDNLAARQTAEGWHDPHEPRSPRLD